MGIRVAREFVSLGPFSSMVSRKICRMAPADQSSLEGRKRRRGLAIVLGTIMHLLYSTRRSGRMI